MDLMGICEMKYCIFEFLNIVWNVDLCLKYGGWGLRSVNLKWRYNFLDFFCMYNKYKN